MSVPISRLIVLRDRLQSDDDAVLKKTLKELDRVDMTIDILKETGIGVSVNQLRHHDLFGNFARQLVSKWKSAAAGETSATSNGYGKRYTSSPSPPPVSKKQKLDAKSSSTKPKPSKVNFAAQDNEEDGKFTAESGSFEQILGLNDYTQRYSTPAKTHHSEAHDKKTKKSSSSHGLSNGDTKRSSHKERHATADSEYSSSKTSSTSSSSSVDWSKVLPTKLATEYRPQPRQAVMDYEDDYRRDARSGADSDPDGFDFAQLKKNKMTKIYSGRRNIFLQKVPTLFESCIHVLCDNIDALGYTGGVPFQILQPVLMRATAAQLYRLEELNPYLLEDTGDLWKGHCNREFKGVEPDWEEGETWRELYERMLAEREKKLVMLKQVISDQKKEKESALRQAKQMDKAKAPREVRRRQIKYGTYRKEDRLPDTHELVQSRKNLDMHPGAKSAGRAYSHIYEEEQRQKEQPKNRKEKIAPLMAKSLKMMKLARSRN